MFPAILHTIAFLICLCVQASGSIFGGAWLLFHAAGCCVLLYNGKYPRQGLLWYALLTWMIIVGASMLTFGAVADAAVTGWMLIAMPSLALCLRKEHLPAYLRCFGVALVLYAAGLVAQMSPELVGHRLIYDVYNINAELKGAARYAWPLMDPNNAAAVLNIGLLSFTYLALWKDLRWGLLVALFSVALFATGSRAGGGGAALGVLILTTARFGAEWLLLWLLTGIGALVLSFFYRPELILMLDRCFTDRFPIWEGSWPLVWIRPWGGIGLGQFGYYYQHVRIEHYTAGWYAHNDLLQMAIEIGLPATAVFIFMLLVAAFTTCKSNMLSGVILLVVFLQAMVEFQFYVWAISLPMGLVLGYHLLNRRPSYLQSLAAASPVRPLPPRRAALKRLYAFAGSSSRRP